MDDSGRRYWIAGDSPGPAIADVDPVLSPDDVEIDLTEFAEEVIVVLPRTRTPRIDPGLLSQLIVASK